MASSRADQWLFKIRTIPVILATEPVARVFQGVEFELSYECVAHAVIV